MIAGLSLPYFFFFPSKSLDHFTTQPETHNSDCPHPSRAGGTNLEAGDTHMLTGLTYKGDLHFPNMLAIEVCHRLPPFADMEQPDWLYQAEQMWKNLEVWGGL